MADKPKDFIQEIKAEFAEIGKKVNHLWDGMTKGSGHFDISFDHFLDGNLFTWELDLPGFKKSEIKVQVRESNLVISGKRERVSKIEKENFFMQQRKFGTIEKSFPLPKGADTSTIKAKFEEGVLTVSMTKTEDTSSESNINVE